MNSSGPAHATEQAEDRHALRESKSESIAPAYLPSATVSLKEARGTGPASNQVRAVQRLAGNRAASNLISRTSLLVQRHPPGAELPAKGTQVEEIALKKQMKPEATRTKTQETTQVGAATAEGKAFQKKQKLTPGAMSLASAQKILQGAFGGVKDIVPGTVEVLADQPACAAKYDEVCIAAGIVRDDGNLWAAGDCAKDDAAAGVLTEGFAWQGVVYVNGQTTLVTATAHEILHNNAQGTFRDKMGETFNEGFTELLARKALSMAGVTVPSVTAYPDQVKFTLRLQNLVGQPIMADAYFGNPDTVIAKVNELKGAGTFDTLKTHAEALDEAKFNAVLAKKKA
ncbi:MAG: hypothetical protein ABI577_16945 [bacterium]